MGKFDGGARLALGAWLVVGLVAAVVSSSPLGAAGSEARATGPAGLCELPDGALMSSLSAVDASVEIHPELLWLEDDVVQQSLANVQSLINESPEVFVGSFIDYAEQSITLLYAPSTTNIARYREAFDSALRDAPAQVEAFQAEQAEIDLEALDDVERSILEAPDEVVLPKPEQRPTLRVNLRQACRDHGNLEQVRTEVIEETSGLRRGGFLIDIDPVSVTVRLTVPAGAQVGDLKDRFGADLTIVEGEVPGRAVGSRTNDSSPHLGGARITNRITSTPCSTGFAMDFGNGRRMATAGHCGIGAFDSGNNYYGVSSQRSFPHPDAQLLASGVETYRRSIYVDPTSAQTRLVTAKSANWIGQSVCTSGSVTRRICGGIVDNLDFTYCDPLGCTFYLAKAVHPNPVHVLAAPGDSGGPVHYPLAGNKAVIRGMIILGTFPPGPEVWFHTVATVESGTGATVAVACCDSSSW